MEKWLATSRFNCWQPATTGFWQLERPTREVCTLSSNPICRLSHRRNRRQGPRRQSRKRRYLVSSFRARHRMTKTGPGVMSNHSARSSPTMCNAQRQRPRKTNRDAGRSGSLPFCFREAREASPNQGFQRGSVLAVALRPITSMKKAAFPYRVLEFQLSVYVCA